MTIRQIAQYLEQLAPLAYQENYDNAGLILGNPDWDVNAILLTLDVTEAVIDEAIRQSANLIVAHHPLIFSGIKKITGKNEVERCIQKAIKNDVAIYAAHTNLDSVHGGVNSKIATKIGLHNIQILSPVRSQLKKLVTFVPEARSEEVQKAIFAAGAGHIGNYDSCGFSAPGTGTFRGNEQSKPFVGSAGSVHHEPEIRFETIFPAHLQQTIIAALKKNHPYEEVAYDIYPVDNENLQVGMGMIGNLAKPLAETDFLKLLKSAFHCRVIRHSPLQGRKINTVAVCGGSGSFLVRNAIAAKADILVTADLKYHQFFEAENQILLADIGHYESEQFTKEVFYELLTKKFPNFAIRLSVVETNPVNYYFD